MGKNKKYTSFHINEIKKLILKNNNFNQISKILNIPISSLRNLCKKNELFPLKKFQRLNINHNYFNYVDTPEKAYILGYFFADGCLEHKRVKRIRFSSAISDFEILKFIRDEISPDTKITFSQDKRINLKIKNVLVKSKQENISFGIVSKNIVDILNIDFNISFDKTYSQNKFNFDKIPISYYRDFIRGFLDGDGSIDTSVRFVSMNHEFLLQIQNILKTIYNINCKFKILKDRNNIGLLRTYSNEQFYKQIYYENCLCLNRKKQKFKKYDITKI